MGNLAFCFFVVGVVFSFISLMSGNYLQFAKLFAVTLLLWIVFLVFGGYQRISVSIKVRKLLRKFPKNVHVIGFKEAAELLDFDIEYMRGLKIGFDGPNVAPKDYTRDVSLSAKETFTKAEIRQLAYFKFSEGDLVRAE